MEPLGLYRDTFRHFHPERQDAFTVWNTMTNSRPINRGTRVDYILVSKGLYNWTKFADILPDIQGSDHCPIFMYIEFVIF